jgi:threonyl-tRNA synthetase
MWLAPRQVKIVPVLPMFDDYGHEVMTELKKA